MMNMELLQRILVTKRSVSKWTDRHPGEAWCIAGVFVRASRHWIVIEEIDWSPAPTRTGRVAYIEFGLRKEFRDGLVHQEVRPGHVLEIRPDNQPARMIANFSNPLPPE